MIPRFENLPQYSRGTIFLRDRRGRDDILNLVLEGPRPVVPPGGGRGGRRWGTRGRQGTCTALTVQLLAARSPAGRTGRGGGRPRGWGGIGGGSDQLYTNEHINVSTNLGISTQFRLERQRVQTQPSFLYSTDFILHAHTFN